MLFLKLHGKLMAVLFIVVLLLGCASESEHAAIIKQAMDVMIDDAAELGAPNVIADSLFFGTTKINGNYKLVDALRDKYNCTATFFVKIGDAFIRVSTNAPHAARICACTVRNVLNVV